MVKHTNEHPAPAADPALKDARPTDIIIPIMGATGAGKSSFINYLLKNIGDQRKVETGSKLASCTYDLQAIVIDDRIQRLGVPFLNLSKENRIVIVDTPGFDDTSATDFQILRRTANWLQESLKRNMMLGGVIYLHDISQDRFSGIARRNLNMFSHLCGEAALDKVVLVTSKWSRQGDRDFGRREKELKEVHWKGMLNGQAEGGGGASVMRLEGQSEGASAWAVVTHILKQLDHRLGKESLEKDLAKVLQIQEELVRKKKSVPQTEAAKELREQLQHALRVQEEMLALEALAAERGDSKADARIKEKQAEMREMQKAIQQNKASLSPGAASLKFFKGLFK